MQLGATLVKGKARIMFSQAKVRSSGEDRCNQGDFHVAMVNLEQSCWLCSPFANNLSPLNSVSQGEAYTLAKAQHAYKSLVKIHEKSGKLAIERLYCTMSTSNLSPCRVVYSPKGRRLADHRQKFGLGYGLVATSHHHTLLIPLEREQNSELLLYRFVIMMYIDLSSF